MDVKSIGPGQLNMLETSGRMAGPSVEDLAARLDSAEDLQGLKEAAEKFEAIFLNQLMKSMRSTVPDNKMFNSSGPTKFYQQMHDAELAGVLASGPGKLGIADMIVNQLERPVPEISPASGSSAAPELGTIPERLGPPAPVPQGERLGPPAPAALQRYRSLSAVGRELAEEGRLRSLAAAQGQAVADTLQRFEPQLRAAAGDSGLDPALVLAVVMEESSGDPTARSPKGAQGLMQLMPGTARDMGVEDPGHPGQNLAGGSRYLSRMLKRYDGDLSLALAAYNAGPGNVDRAGRQIPDFPETQRYVTKVMARYEALGGGTDLATGAEETPNQIDGGDMR